MSKFYITTTIPYVNSDPHIGHALEFVQTDALARYHRLVGDTVRFLTGTDENALKNVQAAEKAGEDVRVFVDRYARRFFELNQALNISNDDFIRTTEDRHFQGAKKLWQACVSSGDIYKKFYKGLYCVECEEFKTQKELVDGLCPDHKTAPEEVAEENYFFRLSRYGDQLLELLESGKIEVFPSSRKNESIAFIKHGLEDFSISRSRTRAKNWGIPVPDDEDQMMYVWFDALTNYINALGYGNDSESFKQYWTDTSAAHVIGKGVTRFHLVYWPAMLLSAGVSLPKAVFVHGYVTLDGEKISKSLGNVISPFDAVERFGADPVRYYLLREFPSGEDGDFSWKKLENRYNSDLANGLGNLVQRTATLVETKLNGKVSYNSNLTATEASLKEVLDDSEYHKAFEAFRLHDAVATVWAKIGLANAYLNENEPWKQEGEQRIKTLLVTVTMIGHIAWLLQPLMPETAKKISSVFGIQLTKDISTGGDIVITKGALLFPRTEFTE